MSNVDNRVVDMQFNNQQFESGVQASLKSVEALKKGLNLDAAAKSLTDLDRAGKSFSLAGISQGVEAIASKFSALGIMGVTALQNITNSAINAGKRLLSSLTVDPIKTGLTEYETKMGAIQTILTNTSSKGTTIDDVNTALQDLNTYSDKTIYNFAEMARNIGTFTAAGVDLNTSVTAIKGIANLAAGSGSNAQQASTAMYQLSQALAAGSVKLMDWNSVVNAGMGGELFQKALEKTAASLGKGRDMSVSFRDSLQDGWITTEVLTKTLSDFANDPALILAATQVKTFTQLFDTMKESVQSGWAVSWEKIIGNKDEAAKTLTALNDAFGKMTSRTSDARNAALQYWRDMGGRDALIMTITNAFEGLQSILIPIKTAFKQIFPPITGKTLWDITNALKYMTMNLEIGAETAYNLRRTFKGLFALLDIGKQAFTAIVGGIGDLIKGLMPAGDGILSFTGNIGDWLVKLDEAIKKGDVFNKAIEKISTVISFVANKVKIGVGAIVGWFESFGAVDLTGLTTFSEKVKARFAPITKLFDGVKSVFVALGAVLQKFAPVFSKLASLVGDAFSKLGDKISVAVNNGDFNSLLDMFNSGVFAAILLGIKKVVDGAGGMFGGITGILDGVKGSLTAFQDQLKAGTLLKIAIAIGILAASLLVLSMIDSAKLTTAMGAISVLFVELFGSMGVFEKIMGSDGFTRIGAVTRAMISMSIAVLILSFAMEKLAKLDWNQIAKGLVAIGALMAMLVASAKLLSSNSGAMIKGSLGFVLFAAAILILTTAVERLSILDPVALAKGLLSIAVIMAAVAGFTQIVKPAKLMSTGIAMIAMGAGLLIITQSVAQLGALDPVYLAKGLGSIAIVLASLAGFSQIVSPEKLISTGIAMTAIGAGLLIITQSVVQLGTLDPMYLAKGLGSIAIVLASIAGFTQIVNSSDILTAGIAMNAIGSALLIITQSVVQLGALDPMVLAKGLGSVAVILATIAGFTRIVNPAQILSISAAMVVMSVALLILTNVVSTLGKMPIGEVIVGVLALAAVFAVIGVAGLVLGPLTPVIMALGLAIALIGAGCALAGIGLLAFSAGLASLAVSGAAGAAALVVIVTAILSLIPMAMQKLGEGIIAFAQVIITGTPVIMEAIRVMILALIQLFGELMPALIESVLSFV